MFKCVSLQHFSAAFQQLEKAFNKDRLVRENIFAIQSIGMQTSDSVLAHSASSTQNWNRCSVGRLAVVVVQVVWKMSSQHHPTHTQHTRRGRHRERVMLFHVAQNLRSLSVAAPHGHSVKYKNIIIVIRLVITSENIIASREWSVAECWQTATVVRALVAVFGGLQPSFARLAFGPCNKL